MGFLWQILDEDGEGSRVTCFAGDSRPFFPDSSTLLNQIAVAPVDQYGALGYDLAGQNPNPLAGITPPWFTCPFTDWCDGPETELVPQAVIFRERWQLFFNLGSGFVFYHRLGQPFVQAPAALFPVALTPTNLFTDFTLSFDADASPMFAFADLTTGLVNLRYFISGVPTLLTFPGYSPKLFFDGQVQRDTGNRDVVVYYLRAGQVFARFQRDLFGVEYFIADVSGTFGALTRLTKVDRNIPSGAPLPAGNPIFHYLFALGTPSTVEVMLQAGPYLPFPLELEDDSNLNFPAAPAGTYTFVIVNGGTYDDDGALTFNAAPAGSYDLVIVDGGSYDDDGTLSFAVAPAGSYDLVIVNGGSYDDDGALDFPAAPAGDYELVVVNAGTFDDDGTLAFPSAPAGTYEIP